MSRTGDDNIRVHRRDSGMWRRVNTTLSLLQHRPHHPDDDVLIGLAIGSLEGLTADELVDLEAELVATRKAGA